MAHAAFRVQVIKVIRVIICIKWRGEHEKLINKSKTNYTKIKLLFLKLYFVQIYTKRHAFAG